MTEMQNLKTNLKSPKDVPVVGNWDVVVCGGGIAGISAACAAASRGARTLLVERLEVLGGLGSSGGVGNFCFGEDILPAAHGQIFRKIWERLREYRAVGPENGWTERKYSPFFNYSFDHNVLPIVLQEIAQESSVDLLFATDVVGVRKRGRSVRKVLLHNRSLLQEVNVRYVIDASGDGILARHAGASELPPDAGHPQSIPPGHMIFVKHSEHPSQQVVRNTVEISPPAYSVWDEPERTGLKMKWNGKTFDTSSGSGYSETLAAFRARIPEFVRHFQETEQGRDTVFSYSAPLFGARDGVRVEGDYVFHESDIRHGRRFLDAVAHGCFPFDSSALNGKPESLPPFQIPYRCLLAKNLHNVLLAGRCFSATRIALSAARIMATCALMGEAAGIAAAFAAAGGVSLRSIDPGAVRNELFHASPDDSILMERLEILKNEDEK